MKKNNKIYIKESFGIAPNELLNDENISLKAKGLFTYIQSKPNGWDFSIDRISIQTKDGKKAIRTALKELEDNGYLERMATRNNLGKWSGYDYYLNQKPFAEKGTTEKRTTGNGYTLSKKDYSKKEIVKKNKISKSKDLQNIENPVNKIIDIFYQYSKNNRLFANTTQRRAIEDLIKQFGEDATYKFAKFAVSCNGKPYAPQITTPIQLQSKLGQLRAFHEQLKNNSQTNKITKF
jgi:predicted DNA-binding protein YlxM (UPF0122 family)